MMNNDLFTLYISRDKNIFIYNPKQTNSLDLVQMIR